MEITESMVYWITRLDGVVNMLTGLVVLSGILSVIACVVALYAYDDGDWPVVRKISRYVVCFLGSLLLFATALVLTPNTKQMCAIKVIPIIASDGDVKEIPSDIVNLAKEWIEAFRPEAREDSHEND